MWGSIEKNLSIENAKLSLVQAQERKSFFSFKAWASSQAPGIMGTARDEGEDDDESLDRSVSGSQNSRHFKVTER